MIFAKHRHSSLGRIEQILLQAQSTNTFLCVWLLKNNIFGMWRAHNNLVERAHAYSFEHLFKVEMLRETVLTPAYIFQSQPSCSFLDPLPKNKFLIGHKNTLGQAIDL